MYENQKMEHQNIKEANSPMKTNHKAAGGRKRRILLVALAVCCIAILATGTLAYFVVEETAYNVITTGILSMDLIEETTGGEPWPEGGIGGIVPGMTVDKIPYVKNTGSVDFYTRVSVSMKVTGENGNALPLDYISLDINTTDWTEKEGYYYYNSVVKPGEKTTPLFTKVSFDTAMDNPYMNAKVEIEVHAEAVQSKNNGASALEAAGWKAV